MPYFECVMYCAGIAQLVEHNLAKVEVAGSSPVFRSRIRAVPSMPPMVKGPKDLSEAGYHLPIDPMATWPSG